MDERALRTLWERTIPPSPGWDAAPPDRTYRPPDERTAVARVAAQLSLAKATFSSGGTLAPAAAAAPAAPARPGAWGRPVAAPAAPPPAAAAAAPAASYEILQEIGRGGMGVVFRARQRSLDREVAVKRIIPGPSLEAAREKFLAEALVTGTLDHPNIVPVHELGSAPDGDLFLAMKLVGGISWDDVLHPRTDAHRRAAATYDLERHVSVLLSACNAVAFAHSRGIVHRDLKPENVMIGEFGEVVVMDWGIAVDYRDVPGASRAPHRSTIRAPSGTPSYMPPELAEGRGADIGPWTDVYLLGAILHEAVTGEPPHRGPTLMSVLLAASRSEPRDYGPSVPAPIREICRRAMAREPRDRFGSVAELADALRGYLKHRESLVISGAAEAGLARCEAAAAGGAGDRDRLYADFADSVAGFRQALVLWAENDAARAGERRARLAWARSALEGGDLGLARAQAAQLEAADPEVLALRMRIDAEQEERARAGRHARLLRRGLAAAAATIIAGLAIGFALVRAEHGKTTRALAEAERQREEAERQRGEAQRQRAEAEQQRAEAERQGAEAERQRAQAEARERDANRHLGRVLFEKADRARADGDVLAARALFAGSLRLDPRPEARRGLFEMREKVRLLWASSSASGAQAVAFSPDGRRLATGTTRDVHVWDVETRVEILRFGGLEGLMCLDWSPDGRTLATGDHETAKLWDPRTGRLIRAMRGTEFVNALAFSPDGRRLAVGGDSKTIRIFEVETGKLLASLAGHEDRVSGLAFFPDGRRLASGGRDGTVRIWDAEARSQVRSLGRWGGRVAVSADGRRVAAAAGAIGVWEVETGEEVPLRGDPPPSGEAVAFSADGRRLAVAGSRTVVLDLETGEAIFTHPLGGPCVALSRDGRRLSNGSILADLETKRVFATRGHSHRIESVAFAPDGRRVASAGGDEAVRLWDAETGKEALTLPAADGPLDGVAWSPDGRKVAAASWDKTVTLWDATAGARLRSLAGHGEKVHCVAFAPDGRRLASGSEDGEIRFWDADTGEEERVLRGHTGSVTGVSFSPGGQRLVSVARALVGAQEEKPLRVWDLTGQEVRGTAGSEIAFGSDGSLVVGDYDGVRVFANESAEDPYRTFGRQREGYITSVALAPGVRHVASAGSEGEVRVWDLALDRGRAGGLALRARHGGLNSIAWSPDGRRIASGGDDASVRLWELGRSRELLELPRYPPGVFAVAFSADGRRLAAHAGEDPAVRVFDAESGATLAELKARSGVVYAIAFSPNGKHVATGDSGGTVRLWDVEKGALVGAFPRAGHGLAFSPDGRRLFSGSVDKTARIWDLRTGKELALPHDESIRALALSPDGKRLATAGRDVRLWDAEAGKPLRELRGHLSTVAAVAFSPDGRRIASGGTWDKSVRVWDADTGEEVAAFRGHEGGAEAEVSAVAFCAGGRRVLSASAADRTVRLWDIESGEQVFAFSETAASAIAASPDGRRLAGSGEDGRTWIRDFEALERFLSASPESLLAESERETGLRVDGAEVVPIPPNRFVPVEGD